MNHSLNPAPGSEAIENGVVNSDKAHVWHHLSQHKPYETKNPMVIVEGKGLRVKDINGREYLDAVSGGVWTVNVGYGRESIAKAVHDQLLKMCYFANIHGSDIAVFRQFGTLCRSR